MDLRELRDSLLQRERPEDVLSMADEYLQEFALKGDRFVLPMTHAEIKPILDYYVNDLEGWVKFIKGVRNRLPMRGRSYHPGVHEFYRMVVVRLHQQARRERLALAVKLALKAGVIENAPASKIAYANKCTQAWKRYRDTVLRDLAQQTRVGRLSMEEREEVLEGIWERIDQQLANGDLPIP